MRVQQSGHRWTIYVCFAIPWPFLSSLIPPEGLNVYLINIVSGSDAGICD